MAQHVNMSVDTNRCFMAKRYMDDVIFFWKRDASGSGEKLLNYFKEECYWQPLQLTTSEPHTYLETELYTVNNTLVHCMKNTNKRGGPCNIWRYAHFNSATPVKLKEQLVKSTLTKVHNLCNDDYLLYHSGLDKLHEFVRLQYPIPMLTNLCKLLAVRTRNTTWFKIKESILTQSCVHHG